MTSQKDIQSLIADIDSILHKTDARLPWSKPSDIAAQRRVLERVRGYLVWAQHQQQPVTALEKTPAPATSAQAEVVQQTAQALRQEINALRAQLLQPLQADIAALQHQRENLVREVRHLERTRQQIDSPPQQKTTQQSLSEFSQELINRCTESLTQHMAQILANWDAHSVSTQVKPGALPPATASRNQLTSPLQPQERVEKLQQLQAQFDHMLVTLDANHRLIFETLQGNLHSYQASLSQEVEKMYSLGVRGEILFAALVNRLANQLGPEGSISPTSAQVPDLSAQPNQVTASQTTAETLPPQLGQTVKPVLTQEQSAINSTDTQGAIHSQPHLPVEDNSPEAIQSQDWEVIEGLDGENLNADTDNTDGLDTFIQLDLDEQASLPAIDGTPERDEIPELNVSSDKHRKEIEDLYETLFGTEASSSTLKPGEDFLNGSDVSAPQQATSDFQPSIDDQLILSDSIAPVSSQVEDALFEGLADPASEPFQLDLRDSSAYPLTSWEDLFQDSVPQSSIRADLAGEVQAWSMTDLPSYGESEEDIQVIGALTDLFDETQLSHNASATAVNSTLAVTDQALETQTSDTDPLISRSEDYYIPASPDEDLLATDELRLPPDLEIHPDQNTLQQLEHDLYNYELFESQIPRHEEQTPSSAFESLLVAPDPVQENQQNWRTPMPELLAEDYEEFVANDLPNDSTSQSLTEPVISDLDLTAPEPDHSDTNEQENPQASVEEISPHSPAAVPESVELDFEPELFPSELDQEKAISLSATPPQELAMPHETNVLEDESLIMLWDEPADGATEEMISSPEMEFEMKSHPQTPLDPDQGNTVDSTLMSSVQPSDPENSDRLHWALSNPSFEADPNSTRESPQAEQLPIEATPEASAIPPDSSLLEQPHNQKTDNHGSDFS